MSFTYGVEEIENEVPYVKMKGTTFGEVSPYPKWKYHATDAPQGIIVDTPEDEEALGDGWLDSPESYAGPHAPSQAELRAAERESRGKRK